MFPYDYVWSYQDGMLSEGSEPGESATGYVSNIRDRKGRLLFEAA